MLERGALLIRGLSPSPLYMGELCHKTKRPGVIVLKADSANCVPLRAVFVTASLNINR